MERPAVTFFREVHRPPRLAPRAPVDRAERGCLLVKLAAEEPAVVDSRMEARAAKAATLVTHGVVATGAEVGTVAPPLLEALQEKVGTAVQADMSSQETQEMAVVAGLAAPRHRALRQKEARAARAAEAATQMAGLLPLHTPRPVKVAKVARAERLGSARQMVVRLVRAAKAVRAARDSTGAPMHVEATAAVEVMAREKEAKAVMVEASGHSIATVRTAKRERRFHATLEARRPKAVEVNS